MNFIEWLDEVDPWMVYYHDKLGELEQFGFKVEVVMPISDSRKRPYAEVSIDDKSIRVWLNTWDDDFKALKARGLPFYVVDESYVGEPEIHGQWGVIPYEENTIQTLANFGIGYIVKNEKNLDSFTVTGNDICRAMARLLTGNSPGDELMGRGSSARADVDAVRNSPEVASLLAG